MKPLKQREESVFTQPPPSEAKPRPGGGPAFWMERAPGSTHWNVWECRITAEGPVCRRVVEATPYLLAREEVWRRTVNQCAVAIEQEYA